MTRQMDITLRQWIDFKSELSRFRPPAVLAAVAGTPIILQHAVFSAVDAASEKCRIAGVLTEYEPLRDAHAAMLFGRVPNVTSSTRDPKFDPVAALAL